MGNLLDLKFPLGNFSRNGNHGNGKKVQSTGFEPLTDILSVARPRVVSGVHLGLGGLLGALVRAAESLLKISSRGEKIGFHTSYANSNTLLRQF